VNFDFSYSSFINASEHTTCKSERDDDGTGCDQRISISVNKFYYNNSNVINLAAMVFFSLAVAVLWLLRKRERSDIFFRWLFLGSDDDDDDDDEERGC
jgi:hypothetical protein